MARIVLLYILPAALAIYALIDCAQDDETERTGMPKVMWMLLILLISVPLPLGPIAWLIVAKIAKPKARAAGTQRSWFGRGPQTRPLAPDDDIDFLRRLDEERRRRQRQDDANNDDGAGDPAA